MTDDGDDNPLQSKDSPPAARLESGMVTGCGDGRTGGLSTSSHTISLLSAKEEVSVDTSMRPVTFGRVDDLKVYELVDYELSQLEAGAPVALSLNIAMFAFGVFATALCTLITTGMDEKHLWTGVGLLVASIVSPLVGLMSIAMWVFLRKSNADVASRIKARIRQKDA